jgi:hypothetical protein
MDAATVTAMVERWFDTMDPDLEFADRHSDFVADIPQSNERFSSPEALREMQRAFPGPPKIGLRRVVGSGDVWVVESVADYDGQRYYSVLVLEFREGLVARETRYYTEPFDAPAWRAQWVEPIE